MTYLLMLVHSGDIYVVESRGYRRFQRNAALTQYAETDAGGYKPVHPPCVGKPCEFGVIGQVAFTTSRVLRMVTFDSKSRMTMEEALFNAEWLEGYEYRVMMARTYTKHTLTPPENPYSMGTPEQKWFENGYYAAAKEAKQDMNTRHLLRNRPVTTELPDAKVETLLKLNERLATQEKCLKLAYGEYGQLLWEESPNGMVVKAGIAIKGYKDSIASLTTAIGVVKALA